MFSGPHQELDVARDYLVPSLGVTALCLGLSVNTGENPLPELALIFAFGIFGCAVNRVFSHFHFKQLRRNIQVHRMLLYFRNRPRAAGKMAGAIFHDAPLQLVIPRLMWDFYKRRREEETAPPSEPLRLIKGGKR